MLLNKMIVWITAVMLIGAPFMTSTASADVSGNLGTLATLKSVVQELQVLINRAMIGADQVLATKLEALGAESTRVLRQIDDRTNDLLKGVNASIDDPLRSFHLFIANVRQVANSSQRRVFVDISRVLAQFGGQLDALPFVNVEPYVATLDPARIKKEISDRRVCIIGYFGKFDETRPVLVKIRDVDVQTIKQPCGYAFDLPMWVTNSPEEAYVPIDVKIPVKKGIFKKKSYISVQDRLYIERSKPFSCNAVTYIPNPEYEVMVSADKRFEDWAATQGGQGRPSNHRTISAEDLFIATVSNATSLYEPKTAKIQDPKAEFWGNSACQDHAGWSGSISRWNADLVEFSLNAPDIGPHNHSGTKEQCWQIGPYKDCKNLPYLYVHGGGGSHANIGMKPTFLVQKKGVPQLLPRDTTPIRLANHEAFSRNIEIPSVLKWNIHLTCSYKDGDDKFDTLPLIISEMDVEEGNDKVMLRYGNGILYVSSIY